MNNKKKGKELFSLTEITQHHKSQMDKMKEQKETFDKENTKTLDLIEERLQNALERINKSGLDNHKT